MSDLKKSILSISFANVVEYMLQFFVPIVVARCLVEDDFSKYRMCSLVMATVFAFAPMHIPQSLPYFLPRLPRDTRSIYIASNLTILIGLSIIGAISVNPWFPLLPLHWVDIDQEPWYLPTLAFFWVLGAFTDNIAISDGRGLWQAWFILCNALIRTSLVALVVWRTHNLENLLQIVLLASVVKFLYSIFYILIFYRRNFIPKFLVIKEQWQYCWAFGISQGLYVLRQQSEQWMVAGLLSAQQFAAFSLGGVAAPIFAMMRQSIQTSVFPRLSELHSQGMFDQLADLNRKYTSVIAFIVFPLVCFMWFYSKGFIELIYTETYSNASGVFKAYLICIIIQVMESSSLLRLCGLGRYGMNLTIYTLPLVLVFSYFGIEYIGLVGGTLGSIVTSYISQVAVISKVVKALGVPVVRLYDFKYMGIVFVFSAFSSYVGNVFDLTYVEDDVFCSMFGLCWNPILNHLTIGSVVTFVMFFSLSVIFRMVPKGL